MALMVTAALVGTLVWNGRRVDRANAHLDRLAEYCLRVNMSLKDDIEALKAGSHQVAIDHLRGIGGASTRYEIILCAPGVSLDRLTSCMDARDTACLAEILQNARTATWAWAGL